jgi:uncharacterized protein YjiS (DUF1127 family)
MFKRLLAKLQEHQMRRVAYWQLQNLTDRDLYDIGVSRSEISRIAYKDSL